MHAFADEQNLPVQISSSSASAGRPLVKEE
jgi:hypothetical protein